MRLRRPGPGRPAVNWHDGGSGDAVLLINGWTASGLLWPTDFVRELESRHRVVRIDNRGTGWSRSAPTPYTIADLADDAAGVLRVLRIERAAVVGLSMGGMIAQELAIRHPRLVDRLVLVGTRPPTPAHIPMAKHALGEMLRRKESGESLDTYFRRLWSAQLAPGFVVANPDVVDDVVAGAVRRPTPRATVTMQARAVGGWARPGRLGKITAATTVVHGSADPLMPVGNGMRLAQLIPNARYVELPGVGHLVPFEAPAALVSLLAGRPVTALPAG